jgi:quercetin dioxygenase-like cupin family protein
MDVTQPAWVADLRAAVGEPDGTLEPLAAVVHRTEFAQAVVQLVPVGGQIGAHHHTGLWDYFIGLSGRAEIRLSTEDQPDAGRFDARAGSFLAVPPNTMHSIRCTSTDQPFVFLLMQAPYARYDYVVGGTEQP